jgi:arsenate reductase
MAEGFLRSFDKELEVHSAGTYPALKVNAYAVQVRKEISIDISDQSPDKVDDFLHPFDYIITVCDNAKEVCPVFTGDVKNMLHIGFDDPADAVGSKDEILKVYRRVRNEIKEAFTKFYEEIISKN